MLQDSRVSCVSQQLVCCASNSPLAIQFFMKTFAYRAKRLNYSVHLYCICYSRRYESVWLNRISISKPLCNPYGRTFLKIKHIYLISQVKRSKRIFKVVGGQKFVSLFRAWEYAGWTRKHDPFPSAEVGLFLTKPITKVPGSRGKMISQIASSSCIGGTKGVQLRCRQTFAEQHNCSFADLGVSPRQYNILDREECRAFLVDAANKANSEKFWIGKQGGAYHGSHMTIFKGTSMSFSSATISHK